ncbi:MAG TPA: hypothetical protein VE688_09055 [Gaiellaceae bacterium]|nr:hypothetical protein [Gaiellaceae bacterium]
MSPAKLLDRLIHPNGDPADELETETPKEVLEALEWSDADSGRDLIEKANGLGPDAGA